MSVLSGIDGIIRNEKGELILDYAGGTLAHSLEEAQKLSLKHLRKEFSYVIIFRPPENR